MHSPLDGGMTLIGCNLEKSQRAGCYVGLAALVFSLSEGPVDVARQVGKGIGDGLDTDGPTNGVA